MAARSFPSPVISIHAPRVGSDKLISVKPTRHKISIHAPRVGSDLGNPGALSVLSHISIHAPRVGSDCRNRARKTYTGQISIHAPRVGSDLLIIQKEVILSISIHAPRVGSDLKVISSNLSLLNFNPRSPCGERLTKNGGQHRLHTFQSTLPVWGATHPWHYYSTMERISIHAPRVGSDNIRVIAL